MQNIFSKIDKKILTILSIVVIVVLIAVFFIYKYSKEVKTTVENTEEETIVPEDNLSNQEQEELPIMENPQIEVKPQPGLIICADQCGDGVCKPADTTCGNSLNCPCDEDKTSCPQDCQ